MITLTTLSNKVITLNDDHIEKIEEIPETIITLTNGKKYLVFETKDEVISKIVEYKKKIFMGCNF